MTTAQELFAKACLVDREMLQAAQARRDLVDAEECLKAAFRTDVTPLLSEWRVKHDLAADPMAAYRASGYVEKVTAERIATRKERGDTTASAYA